MTPRSVMRLTRFHPFPLLSGIVGNFFPSRGLKYSLLQKDVGQKINEISHKEMKCRKSLSQNYKIIYIIQSIQFGDFSCLRLYKGVKMAPLISKEHTINMLWDSGNWKENTG